jgi:hypothetical protein
MKTIKNITCIIISFLLIACEKNDIPKQSELKYQEQIKARLECMNMARPTDSYNYPLYPGMSEWEQLETIEEMIAACQIPKDILQKMSTQAVLQAIWEYPFLLEILHRHQYQMDFEEIFLQNNAYQELTTRKNAGLALLERLTLVNPVLIEAGREPKALEVIMSQSVFVSQLDREKKKTLIEISLQKDEMRQNNVDFINENRSTVWLLIGKTLANANYEPFMTEVNQNETLQGFLYNRECVYIEQILGNIPQLITDYALEYIN